MDDTLYLEPCKEHVEMDCKVCDRYELIVEPWNGTPMSVLFWVGQNAGIEWGPTGMDDYAHVKFIPGKNASVA